MTTDFVTNLYESILGREPDPAGLNFWTAQINLANMTQQEVAQAFVNSGEGKAAAGIIQLYQTFMNRLPDAEGFQYWVAQLTAGVSLAAIRNAFAGSSEFQSRAQSQTNQEFVESLYNDVLGRGPDSAGLAFWVAQLDGGASHANVAQAFYGSSEGQAALPKIAQVIQAYKGYGIDPTTEQIQQGIQTSIGNVIDNAATLAPGGGETFVLTTNAEAIDGTNGNDTFVGVLSDTAGENTLNIGDVIDGMGGTDRFNITVVGTGPYADFTITNVENFFIRAQENGVLDMELVSGAEQLWSDRSTHDLTLQNVQDLATVGMTGAHGRTGTDVVYTVGFDDDVTDANDTLSVVLDAVTSRGGNHGGLAVDGFETFEVTLTGGDSTLQSIAGNELATLNISNQGGHDLTVNATLAAGVTTVDASGMEGALALDFGAAVTTAGDGVSFKGAQGGNTIGFTAITTLNGADAKLSIEGGDGNDTFDLGTKLATTHEDAEISIDGGGGANTLVVSGELGANELDVTNIQTLSYVKQTAASTETLDLSKIAGIETIALAMQDTSVGTGGGFVTANITNYLDSQTIRVDQAGADDPDDGGGNGATVSVAHATETSSNVVNLELAGIGAAMGAVSPELGLETFTANDAETMNIASNANADGSVTENLIDKLVGSSVAAMNVSGDADLSIGSYTTRDGDPDIESDPEDSWFTFNMAGEGDVDFGTLTQGADITRIHLNNNGGGALAVETLEVVDPVDLRMDGDGDILVETLDMTGTAAADEVIVRSLGEGARVIEDIDNTGGSTDIRIRGDQDLTIGDFDEDGEPENDGHVGLIDATVLDASTFTGNLIAALDRAEADEGVTVSVGSGDDQFWLAAARDGAGEDDTEFTFVFAGSDIGEVTIVNFADEDGPNADVLDFTAYATGALSYDDDTGVLSDAGSDFEVSFAVQQVDGADALVATSDDFAGSVVLIGIDDLDALAAANFAGTL